MVIIAHSLNQLPIPQHQFVVIWSGFSLEGYISHSLISLSLSIAIPMQLPHTFKTLPTPLVARKFPIHLQIISGEKEQRMM